MTRATAMRIIQRLGADYSQVMDPTTTIDELVQVVSNIDYGNGEHATSNELLHFHRAVEVLRS